MSSSSRSSASRSFGARKFGDMFSSMDASHPPAAAPDAPAPAAEVVPPTSKQKVFETPRTASAYLDTIVTQKEKKKRDAKATQALLKLKEKPGTMLHKIAKTREAADKLIEKSSLGRLITALSGPENSPTRDESDYATKLDAYNAKKATEKAIEKKMGTAPFDYAVDVVEDLKKFSKHDDNTIGASEFSRLAFQLLSFVPTTTEEQNRKNELVRSLMSVNVVNTTTRELYDLVISIIRNIGSIPELDAFVKKTFKDENKDEDEDENAEKNNIHKSFISIVMDMLKLSGADKEKKRNEIKQKIQGVYEKNVDEAEDILKRLEAEAEAKAAEAKAAKADTSQKPDLLSRAFESSRTTYGSTGSWRKSTGGHRSEIDSDINNVMFGGSPGTALMPVESLKKSISELTGTSLAPLLVKIQASLAETKTKVEIASAKLRDLSLSGVPNPTESALSLALDVDDDMTNPPHSGRIGNAKCATLGFKKLRVDGKRLSDSDCESYAQSILAASDVAERVQLLNDITFEQHPHPDFVKFLIGILNIQNTNSDSLYNLWLKANESKLRAMFDADGKVNKKFVSAFKFVEDLCKYIYKNYDMIFVTRLDPDAAQKRTAFNDGIFIQSESNGSWSFSDPLKFKLKINMFGGGKGSACVDGLMKTAMFGGGIVDNAIMTGGVGKNAAQLNSMIKNLSANLNQSNIDIDPKTRGDLENLIKLIGELENKGEKILIVLDGFVKVQRLIESNPKLNKMYNWQKNGPIKFADIKDEQQAFVWASQNVHELRQCLAQTDGKKSRLCKEVISAFDRLYKASATA